jgi:hypothetical protein
MKQTEGKVFARHHFYEVFLPGLMTLRTLRSCNFLTLLGEDFRELKHFENLGVPLHRVFSVEADDKVFKAQRRRIAEEELELMPSHCDLADYIQGYRHTEHSIDVFNLDICGQFLYDVDPIFGELLLFARRNPKTVMATYSTGARDRPTLKEGLKSLVLLLWLAPEVTDKLVRHLFSHYRSAALPGNRRARDEVSKNMLLRTLFWLRSHMEHIMLGSYSLGLTPREALCEAMSEQNRIWHQFVTTSEAPLTYEQIVDTVAVMHRPTFGQIQMDMNLGDVELLTYASYSGFYHNCYFATYEHDGSTVPLDVWLAESSVAMRRSPVLLVDENGNVVPSNHGRLAVATDTTQIWDRREIPANLRLLPIPSLATQEDEGRPVATGGEDELSPETAKLIRDFAREHPDLSSLEISARLSLNLPMKRVIAQVAVGRRNM